MLPLPVHLRSVQRYGVILMAFSSGCSIWAVELIQREIRQNHPKAAVNAVLIDFFLYDSAKEKEGDGA